MKVKIDVDQNFTWFIGEPEFSNGWEAEVPKEQLATWLKATDEFDRVQREMEALWNEVRRK